MIYETKTLIMEILKIILLFVMIFVGVILSQALGLFGDPPVVKALKYEAANQPNGICTLTREERQEYMDYLRALSGYTFEGGVTNKPIYTIEMP